MGGIFKKFLYGLLYIVTLPLLILFLAIYAVIGIVMFIAIGIKAIVMYFTGRNIFGELPEDIRAREILEAKEAGGTTTTTSTTETKEETTTPTPLNGSGYTQSTVPPGYVPPGYVPPGYVPPGYVPPPGYVQPGYVPPGYVPPGYVPPGYVPPGYVPPSEIKSEPSEIKDEDVEVPELEKAKFGGGEDNNG